MEVVENRSLHVNNGNAIAAQRFCFISKKCLKTIVKIVAFMAALGSSAFASTGQMRYAFKVVVGGVLIVVAGTLVKIAISRLMSHGDAKKQKELKELETKIRKEEAELKAVEANLQKEEVALEKRKEKVQEEESELAKDQEEFDLERNLLKRELQEVNGGDEALEESGLDWQEGRLVIQRNRAEDLRKQLEALQKSRKQLREEIKEDGLKLRQQQGMVRRGGSWTAPMPFRTLSKKQDLNSVPS